MAELQTGSNSRRGHVRLPNGRIKNEKNEKQVWKSRVRGLTVHICSAARLARAHTNPSTHTRTHTREIMPSFSYCIAVSAAVRPSLFFMSVRAPYLGEGMRNVFACVSVCMCASTRRHNYNQRDASTTNQLRAWARAPMRDVWARAPMRDVARAQTFAGNSHEKRKKGVRSFVGLR